MFYRSDRMFFRSALNDTKTDNSAMQEFKRLWNDELMKKVDSRDFSKEKRKLSDYNLRVLCITFLLK